ncbi:MAG TPA: protein-L-isoaspartate(D-aspartate) O-methyltransferase [Geminicoccaceae bacterium]|nr:protein-L-isoaspartate(D-aspartate) O-methyltransferase [Geminicoccaceae bacterium]
MAGRDAEEHASAQRALLETIEREVALFGTGEGERRLDPRVSEALARVPRERFVPADLAARAYDNRPLPIGHGQTISQPLIVAVMTHLLRLRPDARVLEVGTGSGYQTAILAELAKEVVTIEVVEELAAEARRRLEALGYRNIEYRVGDGAAGCPERAPFDGIIVTAAGPEIPPALIEQLAPGGRLVIPIGADPLSQHLVLVEKDAQGQVSRRRLFPVAFVPLTGAAPREQPP